MPSASALLGEIDAQPPSASAALKAAQPSANEALGPAPGTPEVSTIVPANAPDESLSRAARDYLGLQSIGMTDFQAPSGGFSTKTIGRGLDFARKFIVGGLADIGYEITGQDEEPSPNLVALSQGEALPAETERKFLPAPLRVAEGAAQGLVGTAPQLAAVAGAQALGVPAPLAAGAVFGMTPEGFDPEQAAIAAALPYVGRYGGEITGTIAKKFGVDKAQALNIWKAAGGVAGAAAYLATIDESNIRQLPESEQHEARLDMLAGLIGQSVLGATSLEPAREEARTTAPPSEEPTTRIAAAAPAKTPEPAAAAAMPAAEPAPPVERAPKPQVPETPASPYETVLQEIRRNEARTTRQIQELFPKRELTREEARALRNAAWPKEPEPTAAPETEPQPAAPAQEEESPAQVKERLIAARVKTGIEPKNIFVTVNPIEGAPGGGYVQVDEINPIEGNVFSSNPDQMRKLGLPIPSAKDLLKQVPMGRYSLEQLNALLQQRAAGGESAPTPPIGAAFVASTPVTATPVSGHFDVVEADKLLTSFDQGYDARLQPRDRSRQASREQVASIMQRFEPQRLGDAPTTDLGAPLVDESNQVLSGNGRTQSIRGLYGTGKDQPYRDWLLQNAKEFGLDPEAIGKMARPVLVRRVTDYGALGKGPEAKIEFARQSNQQQVAGMSPAEKAASDARLLQSNSNLLNLFRPGEEGNVLAASNREFLNAFIEGTGDKAELLTKDGYNGPVLAKRVKNAILSAFIGPEHQTLANQVIEGADELNVKLASNALLANAPALIRFKGTPYDLAQPIYQALKDLVHIRQTGMKLADFLGQQDLFGSGERSADSDRILKVLYETRSATKLNEGFQRYVTAANEALKDVESSGNLFGNRPPTRQELLDRVYAKPESKTQTNLPVGEPPTTRETGGQPSQPEDQADNAGVRPAGTGAEAGPIPTQAAGETQQGISSGGGGGGAPAGFYAFEASQGGTSKAGSLQGRLSGSARAAAQNDRALRGTEQSKDAALGKAAARIAEERAAKRPALFGIKSFFAPATIDQAAGEMAGMVRSALGSEYEQKLQADFALREYRREFDKTPVARTWKYDPAQPLPRNFEVMRAIDTGDTKNLTPIETQFAQTMRKLLDQAIDAVQKVSPDSLRNLVENYFPRIWNDPETNADKIYQLLNRRPWEGPKSFLRKRLLEYFTDGLALGLRPVSDNPVDVTLQKLGEMNRFAATRRLFDEAKPAGLRKFVYAFERKPVGWRAVDDPSSKVEAPPTVTVKEAYDEQIRVKTLEMLEQLGIPHERLARIGGRGRWGFAEPNTGRITTKFGGPDFVIWHEAGHQLDWRYPDLRARVGANSPNSALGKELAALADLRWEGKEVSKSFKKYVRQAEEKIANLFHAYVHAPELIEQSAPTVLREFNGWLNEHPEVKAPLSEIKPSLKLGTDTTEMSLGGPVKLGEWMMPESAAAVVNNYLAPGLTRFKLFRTLREATTLPNMLQLFGFFHGQFIFNDVIYSGLSLPLYDVLNGKPARALSTLVKAPLAPFETLYRGHKVRAAMENPAAAEEQYRQIAKLATEVNLRAAHGQYDAGHARRWARALREALATPNTGALWEVFWRVPFAAVEKGMVPVMDWLVPRAKYGVFAAMARRVIEDNPNADKATLRRLLAKAADSTEDRLGQVTYDNLFQARTIKDAGQFLFRSYGWQFTKYRMLLGGAADWTRAAVALARGQRPEVTFRMTYLPAMVLGHFIVGGLVTYLLSGKRPKETADYLFPNTGAVDAYGNPVRVSIADFVKDFVADSRSIPNIRKMGEQFTHKLSPFLNMAAEMYMNRDFYGERVFDERQVGEAADKALLRNLREGATFVGKNALPFSVSSGDRLAQSGMNPEQAKLLPWIGIVPAPRYATQSPAEALSADIARESSEGGRSHAQAAHARAVAELVRDLRTGKVNDQGQFAARARAAGVRDEAELTSIRQRVTWTPLQYQVHKMAVADAMRVFDLANAKERAGLAPFLAEKVQRAYDGGKLDRETARRYLQLIVPAWKTTAASQAAQRSTQLQQ